MAIKHALHKVLWKIGYDISRFVPTRHPIARRKQILSFYGIDTVFDVGANAGQFAAQLRDIGYVNRILSFEPLTSAFALLKSNAQDDQNWDVFNYALGETEEMRAINVSRNSYSSSLLDMLPSHSRSAPKSEYVGREVILIKTLDSIFGDLCKTSARIYLKIDTQGFESKVLAGAARSLVHIDTIQMEMSLVPLYDGELLFAELNTIMANHGYSLIAIETGFSDPASGQLLQIDGIFHRL